MSKLWVSLGLLVVLGLSACEEQLAERDRDTSLPSPTTESPSAAVPANTTSTGSQRPEFSSAQVEIEGMPTEVNLKLFNQPDLPFTTYLPSGEFVADMEQSDRAQVVTYYANFGGTVDESAYVRVVLPERSVSVADLQEQILGEAGLMASRNWQITDRTDVVVRPWTREQIEFRSSDADDNVAGQIFIGEREDGQAFYVVMHYPMEYAEGFVPRAMLIIDELKFQSADS